MASLSSLKSAPVRSISLPSRLTPHSIKIEYELNKLKSWENSHVSADSVSACTIRSGLVGLSQLYSYLEELLQSQLTQQALTNYHNGKIIEEALEASIGLLDSCTMAKELSSMLKDNVRNLQSAWRRKGGVISIENGVYSYISCKKKVKKESAKCLKALKQMENIGGSTTLFDVNPYVSMLIRVLREVSSITISILRFMFLFLSAQTSKTRSNRWLLISSLMLKSSSKSNAKFVNEVQSVDAAIQQTDNNFSAGTARKSLEALDDGLGGLEDGLDCLFRHLIRNRVPLLNLLV